MLYENNLCVSAGTCIYVFCVSVGAYVYYNLYKNMSIFQLVHYMYIIIIQKHVSVFQVAHTYII